MKLKPYPEYKDSMVEWIGDMPIGWDLKKIKFVSNRIVTGKTPPSENSEYYDKEELNWFTPGDLGENLVLTESLKKISKLALLENKVIKYKPFSVLMVGIGATLGKLGITNQEGCSNQQINAIEFNHKIIIPKYGLYYLFGVKNLIISLSNASTIGIFNQSQTANFSILNPPFKEQQKIINFLDKKISAIDFTIEKDTRLIELLKEKRTALINHVVTKGLDPTVKMKDSGIDSIGKIPEDWNIIKLKYISDINYGLALELDRGLKDGTHIISLPNVTKDGRLILNEVPYAPKLTKSQEKELLLKKGDLLFNWRSGSPEHVGKTAYFNENGNFTHVSFLLRLRFNKKFNDSLYYHKYLNNLRNTGFFSFSKSKVNKTFNKSELDNLTVVAPPINKQRSIAHYIDNKTSKIDQIVFKIENNIKLLEEYKKSLIHHVVTGKVDVREGAV